MVTYKNIKAIIATKRDHILTSAVIAAMAISRANRLFWYQVSEKVPGLFSKNSGVTYLRILQILRNKFRLYGLINSLAIVNDAAVGCLEPALLIGVAIKSVCRAGARSFSN
jgi:hypothetical protein